MQSSWSPEHYEAEIRVLKQSQAAQKQVIGELRRVEQEKTLENARLLNEREEQAEKIRRLEKMLDLANDKMAEQVRQAREDVLEEVAAHAPTIANVERLSRFWEWLAKVRDANAPND